jgi:hypothetical protein
MPRLRKHNEFESADGLNRASQREFHNKSEKQRRELEDKVADLQERHNDLAQSYKALRLEHEAVKLELKAVRRESQPQGDKLPTPRNYAPSLLEWGNPKSDALDPLFPDVSVFGGGENKGIWGEDCWIR